MFYTKRLIDLRNSNNLMQKDISSLLNLGKSVYGHYERGETIIPIKHLNILANYFNVSLDYIFNFTNKLDYKNSRKNVDKNLMRERLRELRKEYNITQKELASSIEIAPSTISDYERKAKIIATPFLYDICTKYKYSADYLLGKSDFPKHIK